MKRYIAIALLLGLSGCIVPDDSQQGKHSVVSGGANSATSQQAQPQVVPAMGRPTTERSAARKAPEIDAFVGEPAQPVERPKSLKAPEIDAGVGARAFVLLAGMLLIVGDSLRRWS